mgnify:FL=1
MEIGRTLKLLFTQNFQLIKMSKKAESLMPRETILWAIAAFALVVVAFAFFAPDQLWSSVTKTAFAFGIGALPDQEAPQLKGEEQIPPQLKSEFDTLVNNIKKANNPAINSCLVDITELDGFEDNWRIDLADNKAILYRLKGIARLEKDSAVFDNFKPCTIKDVNTKGLALSFYDCYLKEGNKDCSTFNGITPTMETITLDTNSKYKFLFKKGNSFCTFLFYDDGNSDCDRTSGGNVGIDSDCKKKIPSLDANLEVCNQPKALIVKLDTDDSRVEVWDFRLTQNMPTVGENIFMLDNFDHQDVGNECAVLAVEEETIPFAKGDNRDNAQVWYVKPGSIIEDRKIGRLWDGLINSRSRCDEFCNSGDFCVSKCGNPFKASVDVSSYTFIPDNGNARIPLGAAWYTRLENDQCGEGRCELLEGVNNHKYWKPKNEILCDSTGNWKLCNNAVNGQSIIINHLDGFVFRDISYTCNAPTNEVINRWDSNRNKKVVGTRILFVKIDPGDNPIEKWAFYLTDDKELPINDVDLTYRSFDVNQDRLAQKNLCRVYAVNEEGINKQDHLATWYIRPEGRIMTQRDGINNIFGGIKGKIHGVLQDTNKRKASPYSTGLDGHPEAVGGAAYSPFTNIYNNCGNKHHPCNLLKLYPIGHAFIPEHELLCDNDGYWRVCEEYVDGARITADSTTYICQGEVISNDRRWVWK